MKADVRQLLTPLVISSIMWGQDERLQEREELFRVPGAMLRSPDVFGWESALLRSNKKPRKPDLCFATRVDILLLMQMEKTRSWGHRRVGVNGGRHQSSLGKEKYPCHSCQ